jgi:hypothetical protein
MDIYEIKERVEKYDMDNQYFFTPDTMKYFGQTLKSFSVKKQEDGRFLVSALMHNRSGEYMGDTIRYFDLDTNKLYFEEDEGI